MTNISLSTNISGSGPGILLAHGAGGGIAGNFGDLVPQLAEGHTVTGSDFPADDTHLELTGPAVHKPSLASSFLEATPSFG